MTTQRKPPIEGVRLERRRYGRASFFCWAYVTAPDGTSLDLGDPWPGINWPRDALEAAVRGALARHAGKIEEADAADADLLRAQLRRLSGIDWLGKAREAPAKWT